MKAKILSLFKRAGQSIRESGDIRLLQNSAMFDPDWYLENYPDVATAKVDPLIHFLRNGGFEGRDPGANFSSNWYLDTYPDVKKAGINPLVHYLKYGRKEGRTGLAPKNEDANFPYKCPVCHNEVKEFLPISPYYEENVKKYGFRFTDADGETLNIEQYSCPHCAASDRDRLYAHYLEERLSRYAAWDNILLLDIAPSAALSMYFNNFKKITRHTADLVMEGVDRVVDITCMPEIESNSYDILICSHVLEHVNDDQKALSELYRVLKPGGWGIIMVPIILSLDQIDEDPQVTDLAERWRRFGRGDQVHLDNKSGVIQQIESAGFTLYPFGVDYFGESAFRQYGITRQSVLYIAEKTRLSKQLSDNSLRNPDKSSGPGTEILLTIILVTYNHESSLAQALDSVLEQETTYPYEIWICEDCSTDGTLIICNNYVEKYPDKVKLFAQPVNTYSDPKKVSHSDIAIKRVTSKYFCILEGDDTWCDPQKIQIALDILESNPEYVTFAHDTLYNDLQNNTQKSLAHDIQHTEIRNPVTFEYAPYLHTSSRICRNVIKYSENAKLHGDIFLFYIYLEKGPLYYFDKVMSVYNITGKGMWSKMSNSQAAKSWIVIQGQLNKYLDYKHDNFFTGNVGNPKILVLSKKILGTKLAWELWFFLKFIEKTFRG